MDLMGCNRLFLLFMVICSTVRLTILGLQMGWTRTPSQCFFLGDFVILLAFLKGLDKG